MHYIRCYPVRSIFSTLSLGGTVCTFKICYYVKIRNSYIIYCHFICGDTSRSSSKKVFAVKPHKIRLFCS